MERATRGKPSSPENSRPGKGQSDSPLEVLFSPRTILILASWALLALAADEAVHLAPAHWGWSRGLVPVLAHIGSALILLGATWRIVIRPLRSAYAREALRASAMINGAPDGIIITNEQGIVETFNPAAERIFGYQAHEVIGRSQHLLMPEEARDKFHQGWLRYRETGQSQRTGVEFEVTGRRRDGSHFPIGLEFSEFVSAGRRYFLGVVRDISQRKQVEEQMRRYQMVFERTQDVVLLHEGGDLIEFNPAACTVYGYDANELAHLNIRDLRAPGSHPPVGHTMALSDMDSTTFETVHRRKDGTVFPVEVSAAGLEVQGEHMILGIIRDITQRKRMENAQRLLAEIDRRILQNQPVDTILQFVCGELAVACAYPLVWIGLKEPDGRISVRARDGTGAGLMQEIAVRWDDTPEGGGPSGRAICTGQPQMDNVATDPGMAPWREGLLDRGVASVLAIPLTAQGQILGVLVLGAARPNAFDEQTVDHLTGFSNQVAISLQAAAHQEQILLQTVALENAANAVVITDCSGRVKWTNPAFTLLTGYTAREVCGHTLRILKSGEQSRAFYRQLWETILAGKVWRGEMHNRRKDGSVYIEETTITPVRNPQGEMTHFIAIKQDVTERRRHEEQVRYLAMHDPLTDLPNRRALEDTLQRMVDRSRRGRRGALLIMDLDNFKLVNDTLGHPAGDQLLITLANLLRRTLRPDDFLARLGGDEFAVVLEDVSLPQARATAERLRSEVNEFCFHLGGHTFDLGISIGIAPLDGRLDLPAAQSLADSAMYAAKDQGKNRIVVYPTWSKAETKLAEASQWATRIKDALRQGRFVLHFQPVVRLATGQAEHAEVLVRMQDADGGLIQPGAFIPAAERFGLMPQVDRWVLEKSLHLLQADPDLRLFVNLSGASLGDDSLLDLIEKQIRASGVAPGRLAFEITETAAVTDLLRAQQWMGRLCELGCHFALDDFGMGFSSFSYLRALPADYVKIDGSFIRNLDTDPTNRALVQAIKAVAQALGKEVIAEWVESESVAEVLRQLGVEYAQGHRWGVASPDRAISR